MRELAVVERYLFGVLTDNNPVGWPVPLRGPFDTGDGAEAPSVPVLYWRLVSTDDLNAVGPGDRVMSWADYEVGAFHDGNTFGATFGSVALLDVLGTLDDVLQKYSTPVSTPGLGGTIYSVERKYAVAIPERSGGKLYRRDGGVYRIHAKAE